VPKALGFTTEQWVNDRLGGYVKMSIAERREAVKELAAEGHRIDLDRELLYCGAAAVA
jgi:hypothetical protein